MSRLRVSFLLPPSARAGGIGTAVTGLVEALERSCEVGTRVHTLPPGNKWASGLGLGRQALQREVAESAPAVVHTHGLWESHSRAGRELARAGVPEIVSPHGMLDPWAWGHRRWKKRLLWTAFERKHLAGCRVVHALCAAEKEAILSLGVKTPIVVLPNGVNQPPTLEPDVAPPWSGTFGPETRVLLFLGRLHAKKGLIPLVRAWAANREALTSAGWRLAVVGWDDGGFVREYAAEVAALGVGAVCRWFGPAFGPAKAAALARCHGFILPSLSEGLPVAVLEAWSYGKPVLMTEACNLPEGFTAQAAVRIESDERLLSEQLARYLLCEGAASSLTSMGANGRQLVEERFSWPAIAAQFAALYGQVAAGKVLATQP